MFDQTWRWAGVYRTSEKNIGAPHQEIRERLAGLIGDARYWLKHGTYAAESHSRYASTFGMSTR